MMSFRVSGPRSMSSISSLHVSTYRSKSCEVAGVGRKFSGRCDESDRNTVSSSTRRTVVSSEGKSLWRTRRTEAVCVEVTDRVFKKS